MSTASERLDWKVHGLPSDDLCAENAIILARFNRYPLVIDPSGQVCTVGAMLRPAYPESSSESTCLNAPVRAGFAKRTGVLKLCNMERH